MSKLKLGIISDTHDNLNAIRKAVDAFRERGVGAVIHGGDFVAPFAIVPFKGVPFKIHAVFGNNDGEKLGLIKKFAEIGGEVHSGMHKFEMGGRAILAMHDPQEVEALASSGRYDIVIYGHTHEPEIKKVQDTLVINPGDGSGWVKGKSTVAVVDLESMEAEIIDIG
ncbi:MAG: metallophosphoesterase [bacterium]